MNREKVKEILDTSNISVIDELNILDYIDDLEQIKEDYIKSLDKLDVLDNRIDNAIHLIKRQRNVNGKLDKYNVDDLLNILRGENNEED